MKLSIVIPVYNEIDTLDEILERVLAVSLPKEIRSRELVMVDDFSKDGSREKLKSMKKKNVRVFFHEKNQGKGAALRTAFQKAEGDIVIVQDADLEYNPDEYGKLLRPILDGNADVVYGSRFAGGESHRILYFWHTLANRFLTLLSNMLSDLNLTDMETCYKVFRRELIQSIPIEEDRFGFEPEITAKLAQKVREENLRLYEVGISYFGRTYEEGKKIGMRDALRAFWVIWKYNNSKIATLLKYAFNGLLVALSQFISIVFLVDILKFENLLQQNLAYALSIEISILVGFFLHANYSWNYKFRGRIGVLWKFLQFQIVTSFSFMIRQFVFYLFSMQGMHYQLNTLIGILIAIIINFIGYDRLVFRKNGKLSKA